MDFATYSRKRDRRRPAYLKERVDREDTLLLRERHILKSDHQLQGLKKRGLFLKRYPTDSHVAPVAREKPSPFLLLDGMYEQVEKIIRANDCGD